MNYDDISTVSWNIEYIDSLYEHVNVLDNKIKEIIENNKQIKTEVESLKLLLKATSNQNDITDNLDLKLSFNQILDEISRETNIPRESIFVKFNPVARVHHYSVGRLRDPRKITTLESYIEKVNNEKNNATMYFEIASNKKCLEELEEEEYYFGKKYDKIKKAMDKDPLYHGYWCGIKPNQPQANDKPLTSFLKQTTTSDVVSLPWVATLTVKKDYGDMYYNINPKYIDLDEDSYFSKAIKNLLCEEELNEYYSYKQKYINYISDINEKIKSKENEITTNNNIIKLIGNEKEKIETQIENIKWPLIKIRIGDFLEYIYHSSECTKEIKEAQIFVEAMKYEDEIKENTISDFELFISTHKPSYECFKWTMSFSDIMYDGKSLYKHFQKNRGFDKWHFKTKWEKYNRIKDLTFIFDPKYFFNECYNSAYSKSLVCNDKYYPERKSESYLPQRLVRKAVLASMQAQISREISEEQKNMNRKTKVKILNRR